MSAMRYSAAAIRDAVEHLVEREGFTEAELTAAIREADAFTPEGRFKDSIARLEAAHFAKVEETGPFVALLHGERPEWFNRSCWYFNPQPAVSGASAYVREGYTHADLCRFLVIRTAKQLRSAAARKRRAQSLAANPAAKAAAAAEMRLRSATYRRRALSETVELLRKALDEADYLSTYWAEQRLRKAEAQLASLIAKEAERRAELRTVGVSSAA